MNGLWLSKCAICVVLLGCAFSPDVPEGQGCEPKTARCAPGLRCTDGSCRPLASLPADAAMFGDGIVTDAALADESVTDETPLDDCERPGKTCPEVLQLELSSGQLKPQFRPELTNYELSLEHSTAQLTLIPTVSAGVSVLINGIAVSSQGPWSKSIRDIGATGGKIQIEVSLGNLRRAYWISVVPLRPDWAVAGGFDDYAAWLEIELNGTRARLRWVPAGTFHMGSPLDESERYDNEGPQHDVELTDGFWIAETECTQALWLATMGSSPRGFGFPNASKPAESVTWNEIHEFLATAERDFGYHLRLPTEAQWEYACRAGSTESRHGTLDDIAWYQGNSDQNEHHLHALHPVAQLEPNYFGLYDMLGNVDELCEDWLGPYDPKTQADPTGPATGSMRVARGGSWTDPARNVRAAYRANWIAPDRYEGTIGFRLVLQP